MIRPKGRSKGTKRLESEVISRIVPVTSSLSSIVDELQVSNRLVTDKCEKKWLEGNTGHTLAEEVPDDPVACCTSLPQASGKQSAVPWFSTPHPPHHTMRMEGDTLNADSSVCTKKALVRNAAIVIFAQWGNRVEDMLKTPGAKKTTKILANAARFATHTQNIPDHVSVECKNTPSLSKTLFLSSLAFSRSPQPVFTSQADSTSPP